MLANFLVFNFSKKLPISHIQACFDKHCPVLFSLLRAYSRKPEPRIFWCLSLKTKKKRKEKSSPFSFFFFPLLMFSGKPNTKQQKKKKSKIDSNAYMKTSLY